MKRSAPAGWFPKRGEVYWVALEKKRPAVVLSVDALNKPALDICLVPFTRVRRKRFVLRVPIPAEDSGLRGISWAKCDQVTTVPKARLCHPPIGRLPPTALQRIEQGVRIALGLVENIPLEENPDQ